MMQTENETSNETSNEMSGEVSAEYQLIRDRSLTLAVEMTRFACEATNGDEEHSAFLIMRNLKESFDEKDMTIYGLTGMITVLALEIHKRDHA
jgi:hypothetical protein